MHKPMAGKPAKARQNGRGIWLYNAGIRHKLLWFLLLQRRLQDFRSTRLEAFAIERAIAEARSMRSRLAFFSENNSTPRTLPLFSSQGSDRKKQRGREFALGDQRVYAGCAPACLTLSPQRVFTHSLRPPRPTSFCDCKRSGLIRWKRWRRDGRQPVIGGYRCRGAIGATRPLVNEVPHSSQRSMTRSPDLGIRGLLPDPNPRVPKYFRVGFRVNV